RELAEEAGVTATELVRLTSIWTTPGFTDEVIHLYMATGLTAGTPAREPDEFIEVEPHPLSRVLTRIRDGEIRDAKTMVAILYMAGFVMGLERARVTRRGRPYRGSAGRQSTKYFSIRICMGTATGTLRGMSHREQ